MTSEQLTKAKEQAKRMMLRTNQPLPEPRPSKAGRAASRELPIGVYLARARSIKPYRVQLKRGGKAFTVGTFETVEDAERAVGEWKAAKL